MSVTRQLSAKMSKYDMEGVPNNQKSEFIQKSRFSKIFHLLPFTKVRQYNTVMFSIIFKLKKL